MVPRSSESIDLSAPSSLHIDLLCVKMAAFARPNKLYAIRSHREEILEVIKPHLDQIIDACFSRIIISAQAHAQVMNCDSTKKPNQLLVAIRNSVTRTESNYEAFLRVLQDMVPRKTLEPLLGKLNATLVLQAHPAKHEWMYLDVEGVHKALSVPTKLHSKDGADPDTLQVQLDVGDDGGVQFRSVPHSNDTEELEEEAKKLIVPIQEMQYSDVDDRDESFEELVEPIEESRDAENRPSSLKQRKLADIPRDKQHVEVHLDKALEGDRTGVSTVLNWWRQARLECQQQEAVVQDLLEEVKRLRDQLSSAHEEENKLIIKTQKLSEDIETLRHQQKEEVSALRKQVNGDEQLREQIADVEAERHQLKEQVHRLTLQSEADKLEFEKQKAAITIKYEKEIKEYESERHQLQEEIDRLYEEIPRLESTIILKEECIEKGKPSPSLFSRFCNALPYIGMLLLFLLSLVAFLQL